MANTRLYFENHELFLTRLDDELAELESAARRQGKRACARLNNFSDLDWSDVAARHPFVFFYDYTKRYDLMRRFLEGRNWPINYVLTFSRSESNWNECEEVLRAGGNVAVVFRDKRDVSDLWNGHEVVDGDRHDARFLDSISMPGKIVALTASAEARRDRTGFVVDLGREELEAFEPGPHCTMGHRVDCLGLQHE